MLSVSVAAVWTADDCCDLNDADDVAVIASEGVLGAAFESTLVVDCAAVAWDSNADDVDAADCVAEVAFFANNCCIVCCLRFIIYTLNSGSTIHINQRRI